VQSFIYESDPAVMTESHKISWHRALLVAQGSGEAAVNGQKYPLVTGDLFFLFAEETFALTPNDACTYLYITFCGPRADELFRRFGIRKEQRCFHNFDGLLPLWRESLSRASEENIDLAAESMLLYTLSRLSGDSTKRNDLLEKIIELSEENFTDPDLSLAVIADELKYNAKYISHLFKEKMNVSYTEYLRTLRIKHAVSLFEHGLDSIKNVAFLSGFSDPLYFSTVFKQTVGVAPKDFILRKAGDKNDNE